MINKRKLVRITTVPVSLQKLLENQLTFMKEYYDVIAVSSPHGLKEIEKRDSIPVFGVEMTRKITPLKDLLAVWKLFIFFKKLNPLIVHTHTPKAGTVGMLAAKLAGVPIRMHTVAGLPLLEAKGIKRSLLNLVEKITYYCATYVYPNSFGLKKIIQDNYFCNVTKLKVIANGSSNGIDTSYFNPELFSEEIKLKHRNTLSIQPDDFVFIFVGRLVGDKGINELIRAFEIFQVNKTKSKLLLVGQFEEELDPLEDETLKIINTNPNIISVGFQDDVRLYFAIAECLIFPSYREGFPNVVMQAGAMGLPSIVTDINGCNEIIEDGINGIVISVKNIDEIITGMAKIYGDKDLFKKLRNNTRRIIVERFERQFVLDAILKEYKSLEEELI